MAARNMVFVGDPLSTGGAVLPNGQLLDTRKGVSYAYINGKVHCDACRSTGIIAKAGGPVRDNIRGQEAALEGDIVLCKCPVPPTLVARAVTTSKPSAWADDGVETLGELPPVNKADALWRAGLDPVSYGFEANQRILILDEATGDAVAGIAYVLECEGQTLHGITDADGLTKPIYSTREEAPVTIKLKVNA